MPGTRDGEKPPKNDAMHVDDLGEEVAVQVREWLEHEKTDCKAIPFRPDEAMTFYAVEGRKAATLGKDGTLITID